jgi:hypothetical protein
MSELKTEEQQVSEQETETVEVEAPRTFTQEQLDAIVKERVARVKATPPADYEELKTAAGRLAELEAANQSDIEKAQKRIADLERQASDASARAQENLLRAHVVSEAAKRNVVDPDAAFALLDRSVVEYGEDGSPTNIAQAMEQLLEARQYLVGPVGGQSRGNADQGARAGLKNQLTQDDLKTMTPADIVKAQAEGRLDHVLGVSG